MGKRNNRDKNAFNLKTTVDSVCDTDVAAAPNLLLPLSHFYPPLKRRALSVRSVLGSAVKQTAMEKLTDNTTQKTALFPCEARISIRCDIMQCDIKFILFTNYFVLV